MLTTTGRNSGKPRHTCVRAIVAGDRAYVARELADPAEVEAARGAYVGRVNFFDYGECLFHRPGRPTKAKIQELHATWFETGVPLVIELAGRPPE